MRSDPRYQIGTFPYEQEVKASVWPGVTLDTLEGFSLLLFVLSSGGFHRLQGYSYVTTRVHV